MDAAAWNQLENILTDKKVPRSLWPRYFEKEEHRQLRKRCANEEEYRRIMMRRLSEKEHCERTRRERWALFLIVLLWMIQQRQQHENAREFVQSGWRALLSTEHGRNDPESASVALAGITLAVFSRKETEDALQFGAISGDNRATVPLSAALRAIEKADEEAAKPSAEPAPTPQPSQPSQPDRSQP
jgi:hypothetical protein